MSFLTSAPRRFLFASVSSLTKTSSAKFPTTAQPLLLPKPSISISVNSFHSTSLNMTSDPVLNSKNISKITDAEKKITQSHEPVKGGPTAQAQSHAGKPINSQTLHDITEGEKKITGGERIKGGPTSAAQSMLGQTRNATSTNTSLGNDNASATGKLDSGTISKITNAERTITGSGNPVQGGPTAQAQKHANQPINSDTLHDITEGEKMITGNTGPGAGGPTAAAQSALSKSRT